MAAAAAGGDPGPTPGLAGPPPPAAPPSAARAPPQALRRRGDSRRRQAALFFLNNISLDGRPPSLGPGGEKPPPPPAETREPPAPPPPEPPSGLPARTPAPQGLLSPTQAPAGLGLDGQRQREPLCTGPRAAGRLCLEQPLQVCSEGAARVLGSRLSPAPWLPAAFGPWACSWTGGQPFPVQWAALSFWPQRWCLGWWPHACSEAPVSSCRRRVTSQRCSLEFLEDAVGCAPAQRYAPLPTPSSETPPGLPLTLRGQRGLGGKERSVSLPGRTKHTSGSPRHKGLKKTHFIKNMRQYDTRNSRIVLICAKRSLCAAFSVLPYGEGLRISDLRVDSQKQRHPSGGVSVSSEMVFELEGVELGADGKVVSYAKFLYPTNALVTHKSDSHGLLPTHRPNIPRAPPGSKHKPASTKSASASTELGSDVGDLEYNPNLLDDPQWPCGKHKRVLIFASHMTTVIEYVKPSDLKKDMNETFREKFPHVKLTLSKIRSLKREMRSLSEECSLEPVTVAMAYVYFEKLVLQGKLSKQNRKLCAGACVLLAAKISSDLRKSGVKQLIDKLEERFRFNRRDLIGFEFTVLVALELALYLPENQVLPHYRRLTQQL
ncbi:CDK5 and ABL1 enzyme substrate 2 [Plecturocebus cupreus]